MDYLFQYSKSLKTLHFLFHLTAFQALKIENSSYNFILLLKMMNVQFCTVKTWNAFHMLKKNKSGRFFYILNLLSNNLLKCNVLKGKLTILISWWKAVEEVCISCPYLFLLFFCGFDDSWIRFPGFSKIVEKCNTISKERKMYKEKIEMCLQSRNLKCKFEFGLNILT